MNPTASRTLGAYSPAIPQFAGQPALVPVKLSGREGLGELFEYRLTLATPDGLNPLAADAAHFALDAFVGQPITVSIELEGSGTFLPGSVGSTGAANTGAGTREISALITDARLLGEEGRHVLYELTLRPWLHLATLRTNCRIHQDRSVVEVLDALLADYTFPVDKRLVESYPQREHTTQFNESDFAFFARLCEAWGIAWFFEHSEGHHRLVLIDNMGAYQPAPSAAYRRLSFYAPGHKIDEEYVEVFAPASTLTSGAYATRDYDYTRPKSDLAAQRRDARETAQATQEVYEFHRDANYAQPEAGAAQAPNDPGAEGDFIARLRMQALRSPGRRATGFGHLRGLVPGCSFALQGHPQDAANLDYLVLATQLQIEEVSQESQVGSKAFGSFRVELHFEVHPLQAPYRPERRTPRPQMRVQTARVVGPAGQNLWTDALGRVKVLFPWDRYGAPDEHASCWLRVSQAWAGNQLGASHLPRIGQEVLVDYIDGNPDLPVCTGRVHNRLNLPPWQLPGQAALSGIRSRELTPEGGNAAPGRSNHLVLDDTEGHIQVQLKSDHQHSSLSLGDITRIEDNAGRKDARGEGFELRTDGWGAVRADKGLLITTEGRAGARGAIKDMDETTARLIQAREQHETLADTAQQAQAQDPHQDQSDVTTALKAQNAAIQGHGDKFPELSAPHLVLASPAGIAATTAGSTHLQAGEHVALTSGGHASVSAGKSLLASAKDAIRLFVHKAGMRLVAAGGDIDIRALADSVNVLAKLDITHTANCIAITAKDEVLVNGDGSYTRWNAGGIESGTHGGWTVHAGHKNLKGPKNLAVASRDWPNARFDEHYVVKHPRTGEPQVGVRYRLTHEDGSTVEGVTDAQGRITLQKGSDPSNWRIELLGRM